MGTEDARLSPDGSRVLVQYGAGAGSILAEYDAGRGKLLKMRPETSDGQAIAELQQFGETGN
ncbi:hypothetical protein ACFP81_03680 [Deinococcus lacus]|uniref:Uncharacterized protein n=1 Tax=Deinococcus lacus TaxID=392561 RepID=A0ABW1YAI8_9DEIO